MRVASLTWNSYLICCFATRLVVLKYFSMITLQFTERIEKMLKFQFETKVVCEKYLSFQYFTLNITNCMIL